MIMSKFKNIFCIVFLLYTVALQAQNAEVIDLNAVKSTPEANHVDVTTEADDQDNLQAKLETQGEDITKPTEEVRRADESMDINAESIGDPVLFQRKLQFLLDANLIDKLDETQIRVATLQGIVDEQSQAIKKLKNQLKLYYHDLDQRMSQQGKGAKLAKPTEVSNANKTADSSPAEKLYNKAFYYIKQQNFKRAEELFAELIEKFPKEQVIANAHYWQGEIALAEGRYDDAISRMDLIINNYKEHSKRPDAMFKRAVALLALKNERDAVAGFSLIKKEYPNTTVARLSQLKLAYLEHEHKQKHRQDLPVK
jgi:tol-pal system protein YbgF